MQQLHFVELDEGGRLVLSTEDGTRYAVPVDDRLRAALRPRPTTATSDRSSTGVTLRVVQSMIRAGQSAEEVASSTGWEVERVRRYEGPVLAEREHVIGLAQRAAVRAQGRTDGSHALGDRVQERLGRRDVDLGEVAWTAARSTTHGPWTVQVIFSAGGRERRGAWHYDVQTRGLEALDDEARWLSEDEQALPGGLAGHPLLGTGHGEDEVAADLMATMRERRQRRSRRPRRPTEPVGDPGQVTGHVPGQQAIPPEVLPLEDLAYDPDSMGDPPAAHPGGAAAESPNPPTSPPAVEDATEEAAEEATDDDVPDEPQQRPARQQRRRLRLPKLPDPVDPPVEDEQDGAETYARLRDPDEVSFDEFFDLDETSEDEGPDGQDLPEDDHVPEDETQDVSAQADPVSDEVDSDADDNDADDSDAEQDAPAEDTDDDDEDADADPPAAAAPEPPRPAKPAGRKGRPSVPSWDDIMFGARDRT